MKRIISILFLLVLILIPGIAFADNAEIKVTGIYDYDSAYEILEMMNTERTSRGLGELSMNEELLASAMQRAAELAVFYSHDRPDGRDCFSAITIKYSMAAENIAAGQRNSAEVMNSWMNSEGHRNNILTSGFKTAGVGCFYQPEIGKRTWVQLFTSNGKGGYVISGKVTTTATVNSKVDNFEMVCYNPAISDYEYNVYNTICPGKSEEFALIGINGGEGADFVLFIPDEDSYEFRGITPNVTADGKTVTASEGNAILGFFTGSTEIGRYSYEVKHVYDASSNPPTCTQGGFDGAVCRRCGHGGEGKYVEPLGHIEVEYPANDPGCTTPGNTAGVYCQRCRIFTVQYEEIPPVGHNYEKHTVEPTCDEAGFEYYVCVSCDDRYEDESSVSPPTGHKWDDGHVDINTGDMVYFCEVCNEIKIITVVEMLDEKVSGFSGVTISYEHEAVVNGLKEDYMSLSEEEKMSMKYGYELLRLIRIFELYRMGDIDLSGKIDATDLSIILGCYGVTNTPADIAGNDGVVNSRELSLVLDNYMMAI